MKVNDDNYQRIVTVGLIISTLFVVVYLFVLKDIPEIFYKAFELGRLFYSLSLSFIAASLFYFIVDYFPKRARKKALLDIVKIHLIRIERIYNTILKNFNYEGDRYSVENITQEELKKIMTDTTLDHRTEENSLNGKNITIKELFENKRGVINQELNDLKQHVDLFSTHLYAKLVEFKESDVIDILRNMEKLFELIERPLSNLEPISNEFFKKIERLREIQQEWEKNRNS